MSRRLMILLAVLALAVGVLTPVAAGAEDGDGTLELDGSVQEEVEKSPTGSYIVVMAEAPLLESFDQDELDSGAAKAEGDKLAEGQDEALEEAGIDSDAKVNEYVNAVNGFSAVMDHDEAVKLASSKSVAFVLADELLQPDTDAAPKYLGLTGRGDAWNLGYTGEGVVVGVIDTGIWPEHPSFADDGSYPAPPIVLDGSEYAACDFGNTAHNPDDAPFTCNNKLIGARQMLETYRAVIGADANEYDSARDDGGHGTHTASTAAGNAGVEASIYGEDRGTISGIAPRAHVVAYKGLGTLGGFTSDLAAAIEQAVLDGVDVINYSIGGGAGLPGADEIGFLFAADAGVFVATSAGNSGPGAATLGSPGTMPWITTVGANTQKRFFEGTVLIPKENECKGRHHCDDDEWRNTTHRGFRPWIWRDRDTYDRFTGASITEGTDGQLPLVDGEFAGSELCVVGELDPAVVAGAIVLCRRGATARAAKSQAVYEAGGAGMIMYNTVDDGTLASDSHWVPSIHIDLTPGLKIKEYIATADNATAEIKATKNGTWKSAPSMTYFSSRGPNPVVPDIIKPDVTAPGTQILAGYTPTPTESFDLEGEMFAAIQGTSMSSPIVAGLFALIKQAHPDWTPAMARSALMTTANKKVDDNDRRSQASVFDMGAGEVDPDNARKKGSAFQPGLVYDAGLFEYAAFSCGQEWGIFTPGSCEYLESIGIPSDASDLNYASIGIADLAGSQTVVRTVTNVAGKTLTFKAKVNAPKGYKVSVSPSKIKLAEGESATFEITITNKSAPVGEWRTGSLEWRSGSYRVNSPIAVKAALFDAPAEVLGAGVDGAASFDVSFGYTGSYTAAPHGLVADAPIDDVVGQDPDQTYPSADDAPIGVQKYPFVLSGSAFARWSLVIPGDDDIDLFLEDSTGTIIAASTAGGTNELIELTLPADDTYTMVVHGWSVPSEPLPFTLSFWDVPLASGGSLSIDSAPTSATLGSLGTIDISWSGLDAGTEYLGAVSHSDDAGLMGLTLIGVDTN